MRAARIKVLDRNMCKGTVTGMSVTVHGTGKGPGGQSRWGTRVHDATRRKKEADCAWVS